VQVHLPTILDPSGKGKLSKRKKRTADGEEMLTYVHEFREAGYLPEAMTNFLALVGWSYDGQTEFFSRDELIRYFDLESVTKSPGAFSYQKLEHMNATYIRSLGKNDLAGRLMPIYAEAGLDVELGQLLEIIPLIQERIRTLDDAVEITDFFFVDEIDYDGKELIQKKMDREQAIAVLDNTIERFKALDTYNEETIEAELRAMTDELDLKARQSFGTVRVAVTGKRVAPPMFGMLRILGRKKTLQRLRQARKKLA
jgi:glutamyl-tRNA synthetase